MVPAGSTLHELDTIGKSLLRYESVDQPGRLIMLDCDESIINGLVAKCIQT